MSSLYIGTSGFSYEDWKDGVFYPPGLTADAWLNFYAQKFNSVELNVTFYRLPRSSVFTKWAQNTPPYFRFALKGSRYITHLKRLKECGQAISHFMNDAGSLGSKLAVILWQLPPRFAKDLRRLDDFLTELRADRQSAAIRHAFEFRDESWLEEATIRLLDSYGAALCIADPSASSKRSDLEVISQTELVGTDFIYIRFHAGAGPPPLNYAKAELDAWAKRLAGWLDLDKDIYAFFNNDISGYAPANAAALRKQVEKFNILVDNNG